MLWIQPVVAVAGAVVVAVVVTALVALVFRVLAKREAWASRLVLRVRRPFRVTLLTALVWIAFRSSMSDIAPHGYQGQAFVEQAFRVVLIAVVAWLITAFSLYFEDLGLERYRLDLPDNRVARRLRTQVLIVRRLTVAAIVVVAVGAILLGFPGVEAVGASVLASAGLVSVIAGLAAQSTLANVFAGIQLAFSDQLRVDDVVVVEGQWGRIEEVTLAYVVVHIWDDRRLVLPCTYFTQNPFESWTRRNSELIGEVDFDLDWRLRPGAMRDELDRILDATTLWDGRTKVLQITDAVNGFVHVRILVSAVDAAALFDLRCRVREEMITWIHRSSPQAMPRTRIQVEDAPVPSTKPAERSTAGASALFTGDNADTERAAMFTSSIPAVRTSPTPTGQAATDEPTAPTAPTVRPDAAGD